MRLELIGQDDHGGYLLNTWFGEVLIMIVSFRDVPLLFKV
jgi:hypothetical protein